MVMPIIIFYLLGILFSIFQIEEMTEDKIKSILWAGIAEFFFYIGYFISYTSPDYTVLAYVPLGLLIVSLLLAIATAFTLIKEVFTKKDWEEEDDVAAEKEGYVRG